jgi:hypothetical protein
MAEAVSTSEPSAIFYQTTRCDITEDGHLNLFCSALTVAEHTRMCVLFTHAVISLVHIRKYLRLLSLCKMRFIQIVQVQTRLLLSVNYIKLIPKF